MTLHELARKYGIERPEEYEPEELEVIVRLAQALDTEKGKRLLAEFKVVDYQFGAFDGLVSVFMRIPKEDWDRAVSKYGSELQADVKLGGQIITKFLDYFPELRGLPFSIGVHPQED